MKYFQTILCASFIINSVGANLPSGFKKCNVKQIFSHLCLRQAIESAIKQMDRPIKSLGLVSLEPLVIPSLIIDAGSQVVHTQQIYKNMKLSGFNETSCSKAEFNYTTKTLNLECVVPRFLMQFNYEVNGKYLMISVYGKGTGWLVFLDNHLELTFQFGEYEKKGKTYFNILHQHLNMRPKDIDFRLENLFDGDEESSDRVQKIAKENIFDMYNDVKGGYEEAFGKVFAYIFEQILEKVPVYDIFG
ncbi:protein takeout-like [Zophobas morio]|uniref:protein takeout-like n=1 Tax=Zophobas morio TaxID=2755281 RepID=UPI003083EDFD